MIKSQREIPSSVVNLLIKLINALEQNQPAIADLSIVALQGKITDEWLQDIESQLAVFDFQSAKQTSLALLNNLQPQLIE